ncbi:MAG: hypothetical protein HS115_17080 [Spirochaetales bacterium]|nr:hypothetical protein [Spirochaetales bacterium]
MPLPTLQELEELSGSYRFILELQRISSLAQEGHEAASQLLITMLRGKHSWKNDSRWMAATLNALARSGTPAALKEVLEQCRQVPADSPYGRVELFSSLLLFFADSCRQAALDGLYHLLKEKNSAARAIGFQALCNFLLEGYVNTDEKPPLKETLLKFDGDRFFTRNVVDLALEELSRGTGVPGDDALLYDGIIVDS